MEKDVCKRYGEASQTLVENKNTKAMFDIHNTYLEENLFKRLRELTGMTTQDPKKMIDLCNYINWSERSGLQLNFALTERENRLINLCIEMVSY